MKHALRLFVAVCCCCIALFQAHAQPAGSLDPTFANGGIGKYSVGEPLIRFESKGEKIILQSNGKIILAGNCNGSMVVTRLNADGTTDVNFGQNGKAFTRNGSTGNGFSSDLAAALQQPDGKILLAGGGYDGAYTDFSVVRLTNNGSLDSSFDNDGKLLLPVGNLNDRANSIALQPEGKILVAGTVFNGNDNDFSVVRLNSNGSLDSSFGDNGKLLIQEEGTSESVLSMALQPDGKILLAGSSSNAGYIKILTVRLNSDGSLDNSFNGDGKLLLSVSGTYDYASSVAVQPDGKILLGGNGYDGKHFDFLIVRLNNDASLDSSFDGDGKLMIHLTGFDDKVNAITLQPDNKILLAGYSSSGISNLDYDFSIVRVNSNGSLDKSFDNDGKLILPVGSSEDVARSVALQPDGKIFLSGSSYEGSYKEFSVVRLNNNGSLDNSFDSDGKLFVPIYGSSGYVNSIVLQPDSRILLAGTGFNGSDNDFLLMRLNSNGTPDSSFNEDGKLLIPVGNSYDEARSMALQPDGKILLAGISLASPINYFSMVRLNGDGNFDSGFAAGGKLLLPTDNSMGYSNFIVQSDGKILLTGQGWINGNYQDFLITRLNHNGSIDSSFGKDGRLLIPVGIFDDYAHAVAIQPDGKILLAGNSYRSYNKNADYSVVRLNSNGTLDNSFDGDGKVLIPVSSSNDYVNSIAIQPDGKILLGGSTNKKNKDFFSMVRLNSDGSLDSSFNKDGIFLLGGASGWLSPVVSLQPDGKVLLASTIFNNGSDDFLVVRLKSNGAYDKSFGIDGKAIVNVPEYAENARASVLQPDGKLIVAGYGDVDEPGNRVIAMRFLCCDDGACPVPKIKVHNAAIVEGNTGSKKIKFPVTLTLASTETITVDYKTINGTAKSPSDYLAKSGTVTFAPGATEAEIAIVVNGDTAPEAGETFRVELSNAINAIITHERGIGTILDNDGGLIAGAAVSDIRNQHRQPPFIKIYPNPANMFLKAELSGYSGKVTVQLRDLQGRVLKQQMAQAPGAGQVLCEINLVNVEGGVYLLHVLDEQGKQQTGKVTVVK